MPWILDDLYQRQRRLCQAHLSLTGILFVMQGGAEDLQWSSDVHNVHALVKGDKNLDRLSGLVRFLIDCTHFDDWLWEGGMLQLVVCC